MTRDTLQGFSADASPEEIEEGRAIGRRNTNTFRRVRDRRTSQQAAEDEFKDFYEDQHLSSARGR